MKIRSVFDPAFDAYGRVVEGLDTAGLLRAMNVIPMPESGTEYAASVPELEAEAIYTVLGDNVYGGMPIQIGCCRGSNTKLNCLEYHRDSEINISDRDFILLIAPLQAVREGRLDTKKVEAFRAPAGAAVELYATTLHYAPCDAAPGLGFRVAVVLPQGTNTACAGHSKVLPEDQLLWARNKWLLAHPESAEANLGAYVGLIGPNIDIAEEISL